MSEHVPPRHGEDEYWHSEPMPVCPICGGLLRRDQFSSRIGPERLAYGPWRCDVHKEVDPEWVYSDDEEEGGDE